MKKLNLLIGILLASVILLCACDDNTPPIDNTPQQLKTPSITYFKSVLSWDEIEHADKYELSINDEIIITYDTSYKLNISLQAKSYDVKIKAISEKPEYLNSTFSEALTFSSYSLPTTEIKSISYCEEKDSANISLDYQGNFVKLYINDKFEKSYTSKIIELSNTQFNTGKNIATLITCSNNDAICDSELLNISVYKNDDFDDIRYEDGKLFCSLNQNEIEYDTTSFPSGESEQIIRNKATSSADITLSSSGINKSIKKLASPKIESCTIIEIGSHDYIIEVSLTDLGIVYDKIELIINSKTFPTSFICDDNNIVYKDNLLKIVFDISRTSAMGFETFDLKLYKDSYISTSLIECKN